MNKNELKDWCDGARRALDKERERIIEKLEMVDGLVQTMEAVDEIQTENESLKTEKEGLKTENEGLKTENEGLKNENEGLRNQVQVEKDQRIKAEMQLKEMSKLSAGVAKKASHDELLKAIRVFVNKSKRKKVEKRIAVKEMVLEMANANGVVLPEDLAATIDALDDEQLDARVVNVQGNYNDIHDNTKVNIKDKEE